MSNTNAIHTSLTGPASGSGGDFTGLAADLQRNRAALDALMTRLDDSIAHLPKLSGHEWRGPAAVAFRMAVDVLELDLARAVGAVFEARQLTARAIVEVESHV